MIKSVKKALPVVVLIMHTAGAIGLWSLSGHPAILIGSLAAALIIALLLYAVIRWDDEYAHKEMEKRQLANVVDHAMDAIVIFDASGQILYANQSACQAYGPHVGLVGQSFSLIGLDGCLKDEVCSQALAGRPWNGELVSRHQDGQECVHLVNIFRLEEFQGHQEALVSIARDLTQRKVLERRLLHSQKLAAVGQLAAGVSHEINNPMAAIQSQIGLARDLLTMQRQPGGEAHQEIIECIDETSHQIKRCSQIVESLLRFSRRQEPQVADVCLGEAIQQAIKFIESLPKMIHVQIAYQPEPEAPRLRSDPSCISQILVNLLVNAADAMDHQGQIRIATRHSGPDQLSIDVLDEGCGITPQDLERVFDPFFTTKPQGQGTGLGLSISYGLAESLGGELRLHCPAGGGTVATLTLPLSKPARTHQPATA